MHLWFSTSIHLPPSILSNSAFCPVFWDLLQQKKAWFICSLTEIGYVPTAMLSCPLQKCNSIDTNCLWTFSRLYLLLSWTVLLAITKTLEFLHEACDTCRSLTFNFQLRPFQIVFKYRTLPFMKLQAVTNFRGDSFWRIQSVFNLSKFLKGTCRCPSEPSGSAYKSRGFWAILRSILFVWDPIFPKAWRVEQ